MTERAASDRPRLLLVDDEQEMAELLAVYFEHAGFQVDVAVGPSGTIDAARPDVLVTDYLLNGQETGICLARRLRERDPTLPVVVVTGFPRERVEESLGDLAGIRVLTKPARPRDLLRVIGELGVIPRDGNDPPSRAGAAALT